MAAAVGLLFPIVAAWAALRATRLAGAHPLVTAMLAVCTGIGVSAVTTFWWAVAGRELGSRFVAVDTATWIAVAIAGWLLRRPTPSAKADSPPDRFVWAARIVFAGLAAVVVTAVVLEYLAAPHGQWDAWAIWNQKARFLVRDIGHWRDMQAVSWSNPGHPFLVSLSVARLWAYAGSETTLVPAAISALWGGAIVIGVIGALGPARWQAWVGGALVLAPEMFPGLAAAQTADLAVALFVLATLIVTRDALGRDAESAATPRVALAAALATMAAFTKNEGLLFAAVLTAVVGIWSVRRQRIALSGWWLAGLLPIGFSVVWYKLVVAPVPPEYLMEAEGAGIIDRLLAWSRHTLVIQTALPLLWGWGGRLAPGLLPLTLAASVVCGIRQSNVRSLLTALALMLAGYYAVWVVSALDTAWLVRTTFDRLLMQLWPSLVFTCLTATLPRDRIST